jgi:hypothetical protein
LVRKAGLLDRQATHSLYAARSQAFAADFGRRRTRVAG